MNAIIYARFSPRPNVAECESILTQIERATAYCAANGLTIEATYQDENLSGARADNRPGLQSALDHACRSKAVLIVYSLSRLARNTKDAIEIVERIDHAGAHLASLHEKIDTTSASGRLFFKIMAALAEFEREIIAERTSDAMLRHQASGRRMSDRIPYGFQRDPERPAFLVVNEEEQVNIAQIKRLRHSGLKLREICREMQSRTAFRGGRWHHVTVRRILQREGVL